MRRFWALLLAVCVLLGSLGLGESDRGDVEIINDEIEGEDALIEEEGFDDNDLVYDPDEELMLDEITINNAFEALDGVKNILLLGIDSRTSSMNGRSDTMILLTVDAQHQTIKMTSFLRDTYVEIPGHKNNRLNAAYAFGGFSLLADTLKKNYGIKPDAYVAINLSGLVSVIDQLGGVYVDVPESKVKRVNAVIYWYNKQVLGYNDSKDGYLSKGGYQLLNGKQAEAWARYRYTESDLQRAARQRLLIQIVFNRICEMSVAELSSFAIANSKYVKTNMSISDIVTLAPAVLAMRNAEVRELQIPEAGKYTSRTISGMSVLVPNRQSAIKALNEFLSAP